LCVLIACSAVMGGLFVLSPLAVVEGSGNALRLSQMLSSVCVFLMPSVATAALCWGDIGGYLSLRRYPDMRVVGATCGGMLLLNPVVTLSAALNERLQLPAGLGAVEEWMLSMESYATELTERLLTPTDGWSLPFNLLVMGVAGAVSEEFFFRGALQRIIGQRLSNPHAVIWATACVFSAVHLQFYGFLPRLLIGGWLGYLLYWSGSLWLPVCAHFTHNAVIVVCMYYPGLRGSGVVSGDIPSGWLLPFCGVTLLSLCLFLFVAKYIRQRSH